MAAGMAAGGHYDPKSTGKHLGPMGEGHGGDLPVLVVAKDGTAKEELVAPHLKSGKLIALGVTSAEPTALAPGIPTVAASGLPGYELIGATGMWEPAKTPAAAIKRVNQEVVRFLNQPDVKDRFLSAQSEVVGNTSEQFAALIKSEIIKWNKVIKEAGISPS